MARLKRDLFAVLDGKALSVEDGVAVIDVSKIDRKWIFDDRLKNAVPPITAQDMAGYLKDHFAKHPNDFGENFFKQMKADVPDIKKLTKTEMKVFQEDFIAIELDRILKAMFENVG